jgi:predicted DNA-binding protein YlxM (UPF0122 family)
MKAKKNYALFDWRILLPRQERTIKFLLEAGFSYDEIIDFMDVRRQRIARRR